MGENLFYELSSLCVSEYQDCRDVQNAQNAQLKEGRQYGNRGLSAEFSVTWPPDAWKKGLAERRDI